MNFGRCQAAIRGGDGARKRLRRNRVTSAILAGSVALVVAGFVQGGGAPLNAQQAAAAPAVDFERDVEPILKAQCWSCHGEKQQMGGLRLDRPDTAMQGGYSGPVIQPGNAAGSRLYQLVSGAKKPVMPFGGKLTDEQVGVLRAWIDQGAKWPAAAAASAPAVAATSPSQMHWAFRPVTRPTPPAVRNRSWVRNPIDAFVLSKLEREGIQPSPEADGATLLRRLSLDLTGLPPTPEEVAAFLADRSPSAYERAVDRLLQSPHYGEKWARHWLDLARYADSDGYRRDELRPHAWRWRHWVVEAFNRDMPYDRFVTEQLAGDLLPHATAEQRVATGFHRNAMANRESGIDNERTRVEQVVDRTNTVGTVFLGLTVGCAQCHNHRYDPISQKEYYQLFAFFDDIEDLDIDAPLPGEMGPYLRDVAAYRAERQRLLEEYRVPELMGPWEKNLIRAADNPGERVDWDNALTELRSSEGQPLYNQGEKILRTPPEQRTEKQQRILVDHFIVNYRRVISPEENKKLRFADLRRELQELEARFPALSQAQTVVSEKQPRKTHILLRGDYRSPGMEVQRGGLAVLNPMPPDPSPTRLTLARWITARENPLTARVAVNRFWQELFGRGLSKTPDNFGSQGEPPSHPELLDWLASEFVDQGWSIKHIIKTIVMSSTYRQSSTAPRSLVERDPDNDLLARQRRVRLPAELVWDSALAVGGLLELKVGGPSVPPPSVETLAAQFGARSTDGSRSAEVASPPERTTPGRYRRGLYIQYRRITPHPMLANFDAPDSYAAACSRDRSNTPLQALNLLNDPVFLEAAQGLAARTLLASPGGGIDQRIEAAFQLALARKPNAQETASLSESFRTQRAILSRAAAQPLAPFASALGADPVDAAAWVGVSSVLLNLDEFITRE